MAKGTLQVRVTQGDSAIPIDNARVTIAETTSDGTRQVQQEVKSNIAGLTSIVDLDAPNIEFSQRPSDVRPYSTYDITVRADGFEDLQIKGTQVFPERLSLQDASMKPITNTRQGQVIVVIPEVVLFGNFPPKIPESEVKPMPPPTGGVVLQSVVVPQFIVVHLGDPNDPSAENVTVNFPDYIKNVCSSEIYSTWPDSTIRANVYCILSFILNRIYTEWYRNQGKPFQITNSTAYDQAFFKGRNIYDNISKIVDEIFTTYVKRPGQSQPLFTQFSDGVKVVREGWLSQWGSKTLGDQGRTPIQILRNFYGNDVQLAKAEKVTGIPQSYPGYTLGIGAKGQPVRTVQTFLNRISVNYPLIPKMVVDGSYGSKTAEAVRVFQGIFNLPQTGNVDFATWYAISRIYVGVTKMAELRGEDNTIESLKNIFIPPIVGPYDGYLPVVEYPNF